MKTLITFLGSSIWIDDESFRWFAKHNGKIREEYYIECGWTKYGIFANNQMRYFTVLHQILGEIVESKRDLRVQLTSNIKTTMNVFFLYLYRRKSAAILNIIETQYWVAC